MSRRTSVLLLLLILVSAFVCETASAVPRWRRSRNYYTYSSGFVQVANKSDSDASVYPRLQAYCDYDAAQSEEVAFKDKISVFMNVWDQEILSSAKPLIAEVKITDTSDYQTSYIRRVPVTLSQVADQEYQLGTFDLTNAVVDIAVEEAAADEATAEEAAEADASEGDVAEPEAETEAAAAELIIKPATVYRLFITLHRESEEYDESSAWGRLPGPYYVVTSGDSRLEKARHQIVMRTFREWYYKERGWNRNAHYPMDCHAYYRWAAGPCTVGSSNGWANLGAIFGTYHNGSHIADLMESDRIHGDYVRKPGHTFMLLSYDAKQRYVLTMEANFNHTIEICQRSVDSGWTVGHLEADHIRPDLFEAVADMDVVPVADMSGVADAADMPDVVVEDGDVIAGVAAPLATDEAAATE